MNRQAGIRDWPAKRAFLRAVYDEASDKALVVRVIAPWVAQHDRMDFAETCYDSFRKWGQHLPRGDKNLNFWKWIIEYNGLRAKPAQLWPCSIGEFIEFFPPAEVDVRLAVEQLVIDERAKLEEGTKETLRKRFTRGTPADGVGNVAVFPEFSVDCSELLSFEGPQAGLRRGRVQHLEFYTVPEAAAAWTAMIDSKNYRMYLDCVLSLRALVESTPWLKAIEDGRHQAAVVLGGGGSPEKDWVVANSLLGAVSELDLVLTDISFYMINESAKVLSRRLRKKNLAEKVHAAYRVCDFLRLDEQFQRKYGWQSVVWTLLGGTIGNVPSEREFFRSINSPSRVGDLLVLGIDTIDNAPEVPLEDRLNAEYRSKELDDLLLTPIHSSMRVDGSNTVGPVVSVTVTGHHKDNHHSEVANTRTAVFSTPLFRNGEERETILATSTRYVSEDFIAYARRFGWDHLGTARASSESTFQQLLLQRVE